MADAIRRRMVQQDEFTDDQVEPAHGCLPPLQPAAAGSARLERVERIAALAADLGLSRADPGRRPWRSRFFGSAWAALEAVSPVLQRRRVRFVDLPAEIAAAEALLHAAGAARNSGGGLAMTDC